MNEPVTSSGPAHTASFESRGPTTLSAALRSDPTALLARYARTRDARTRNALILHHQPLVRYIAARFSDGREPMEDLIQVGTLALIKAIDGYDPARQIKFSTYAMPTILGEIKRHFRDKTWHVKVPRWLQERSLAARKAEQSLSATLGRSPRIPEIAAHLGLTEEEILEALSLSEITSVVSLDNHLDPSAGSESATLADVIGRIDAAMHDVDAYTDLRHALNRLDKREADVLHMRFFQELSQRAISQQLGVSQMQVSRLERRALERLRAFMEDIGERTPPRRPLPANRQGA